MQKEFLRRVDLFDSLEDADLGILAKLAIERAFAPEEVIIEAEREGDTLFIIQRGLVKVGITHSDGREVILSLLGEGEVFGELALLDSRPRSANVVALEETELIMLRQADFLDQLESEPRIAISLLEKLAERLRQTDHLVEGLALLNVTTRVAQALLYVAIEQGRVTPDGILLEERPPQLQLASMAGTTRETVSRVMRQLEDQGYINCRDRSILIVKNLEDNFESEL